MSQLGSFSERGRSLYKSCPAASAQRALEDGHWAASDLLFSWDLIGEGLTEMHTLSSIWGGRTGLIAGLKGQYREMVFRLNHPI